MALRARCSQARTAGYDATSSVSSCSIDVPGALGKLTRCSSFTKIPPPISATPIGAILVYHPDWVNVTALEAAYVRPLLKTARKDSMKQALDKANRASANTGTSACSIVAITFR